MERVTGIEPVLQPWEGRVLPLYYTRKEIINLTNNHFMKKIKFWQVIFFISTPLIGVFFIVNSAWANDNAIQKNESYFIRLDKATIAKGYTVKAFDSAIKLSLIPEILDEATGVDVMELHEKIAEPWQLDRVSEIYQFEFRNKDAYDNHKPFIIQLKYKSDDHNLKQVYYYDKNFNGWRLLPTKDYAGEKMARAYIHLPFARVAVFSNPEVLGIGRASWYAYKGGNFAASPDFPKGSRLRVTNVENNKYVDVEINDWGPDRKLHPNRVVDLDKVAFSKIAKLSQGVIDVNIEPLHIVEERGRVSGVKISGASSEPEIKSKSALVMNISTDEIIWSKNMFGVLPIASLTKIISAAVFLDLGVNPEMVVEYKQEDEDITLEHVAKYESARLRLKDGDKLKVKDLLYSTLMTSTNNTTETLARISGISREQFIKRMNDKAREWGAVNTVFKEPTGLSPENVSTVWDYAIISKKALKNPEFLKYSTTKEYRFKTSRDEKNVLLRNTNNLLNSDFYILGGKTGYLNEAGYCLMAKINTHQGELLAVLLGAEERIQSFEEVENLLKYSMRYGK